MKPIKLAYLVSHPIQYHAPLLRAISSDPRFELTVFFCSSMGAEEYFDSEFKRIIQWDTPLLDGYTYEILPAIGFKSSVSAFTPLNYGLTRRLQAGEFDALWIHGYARTTNIFAAIIARLCGTTVLIRDDATLISRERSWLRSRAKKIFFWVLSCFVDSFLSVGSRNTDYYQWHSIPQRKITLLPYLVDNDYFHSAAVIAHPHREVLRRKLGLDPERPVILFVGKFIKEKAPEDLLAAYEFLLDSNTLDPLPYLLFIGDGMLRPALEKKIQRSKLNSFVRLLGFVNQKELPQYYDLCDLFVLPSVHETWGLVVNEVMNAARPVVVSTQVGCSVDLVHEGENGYIFKAGDIEDLAQMIQKVLSNPQESQELGKMSLEIIQQHNYLTCLNTLAEELGSTQTTF